MQVLCVLAWIGVFLGCGLGGLIIVGGMAQANSAPQEAVVVCLGLACAIIPYCAARSLTEMYKIDQVPRAIREAVRELKHEVPIGGGLLRTPASTQIQEPHLEPKPKYNHESITTLGLDIKT